MEICSTPVNNAGPARFASPPVLFPSTPMFGSGTFQSPPASATHVDMVTEADVLDQVARMTLDNDDHDEDRSFGFAAAGGREMPHMAFPMTPTTPPAVVLRKRGAASTPKLLQLAPRNQRPSRYTCKKPRPAAEPIPMFPATPNDEENHTRSNVFSQHRPLFSPAERTSHVNMDFLAVLQARYQQAQQQQNQTPSERGRRRMVTTCDCFPTLEETQDTSNAKVLKMRRCAEEFALLATHSGL